jgi:hypothetical protein
VFRAKRLLNTGLCWRHAGKDQLDFRSLAGFAIEIEPAAQAIRDNAVDDMKAEANAASIAARREERIERLAPDIEAHAAAIIGKDNFDIVRDRRRGRPRNGLSQRLRTRRRECASNVAMGQNRKSSMRANVFRCSPNNGHRQDTSACPFRANL